MTVAEDGSLETPAISGVCPAVQWTHSLFVVVEHVFDVEVEHTCDLECEAE